MIDFETSKLLYDLGIKIDRTNSYKYSYTEEGELVHESSGASYKFKAPDIYEVSEYLRRELNIVISIVPEEAFPHLGSYSIYYKYIIYSVVDNKLVHINNNEGFTTYMRCLSCAVKRCLKNMSKVNKSPSKIIKYDSLARVIRDTGNHGFKVGEVINILIKVPSKDQYHASNGKRGGVISVNDFDLI